MDQQLKSLEVSCALGSYEVCMKELKNKLFTCTDLLVTTLKGISGSKLNVGIPFLQLPF